MMDTPLASVVQVVFSSRLSVESWGCEVTRTVSSSEGMLRTHLEPRNVESWEPWEEHRWDQQYRSNQPGDVSSRYYEEVGTVDTYVPNGTYELSHSGGSCLAQIETWKFNVGLDSSYGGSRKWTWTEGPRQGY